jgi:hypothetical protein
MAEDMRGNLALYFDNAIRWIIRAAVRCLNQRCLMKAADPSFSRRLALDDFYRP